MSDPLEISTKDLRRTLGSVLNDVVVRRHIVYITSNGKRVAALVPVPDAEQIEARRAA